jgi:hypothetical protein
MIWSNLILLMECSTNLLFEMLNLVQEWHKCFVRKSMLSSKLQNFYILDTCHPTNPHPLGQTDPFHLLYDRGGCTIKWALWTCKKVVKVARQITNDHHPSHIFHGEQSVCVCVCVWAWHWNLTTTHHLFACNTTTQFPHLKDLPFTLCCSHCPPFAPAPSL